MRGKKSIDIKKLLHSLVVLSCVELEKKQYYENNYYNEFYLIEALDIVLNILLERIKEKQNITHEEFLNIENEIKETLYFYFTPHTHPKKILPFLKPFSEHIVHYIVVCVQKAPSNMYKQQANTTTMSLKDYIKDILRIFHDQDENKKAKIQLKKYNFYINKTNNNKNITYVF